MLWHFLRRTPDSTSSVGQSGQEQLQHNTPFDASYREKGSSFAFGTFTYYPLPLPVHLHSPVDTVSHLLLRLLPVPTIRASLRLCPALAVLKYHFSREFAYCSRIPLGQDPGFQTFSRLRYSLSSSQGVYSITEDDTSIPCTMHPFQCTRKEDSVSVSSGEMPEDATPDGGESSRWHCPNYRWRCRIRTIRTSSIFITRAQCVEDLAKSTKAK